MECMVTWATGLDPASRPVEIVERKGLGHPDTICDALAEEFGRALSRHHRDRFGAILHHNVDKALLFGGASQTALGGGRLLAPIEIYLAGRATQTFRGVAIPVAELADAACQRWFEEHFHALDYRQHVKLKCLTRPGSTDLVELFERQRQGGIWLANDTSCGVGFAPTSILERIVLDVEHSLNSADIKQRYPEIGEDIKILGQRRSDRIALTLAVATIDRFLNSTEDYLACKTFAARLAASIATRHTSQEVTVDVNMADDVARGQLYLTVTGTSAEAGDDGQVGRGNRANGLITPCRPMTMEASAGKNPVTHVGKLYNVAAERIAQKVVCELPETVAAECYLVSQIGRPVQEPKLAEVRVELRQGESQSEIAHRVRAIVSDELAHLPTLWTSFLDGSLTVY